MSPFIRALFWLALVGPWLAACSADPPSGNGVGTRCIANQTRSCTCGDNRSGIQVCDQNQAFLPCECQLQVGGGGGVQSLSTAGTGGQTGTVDSSVPQPPAAGASGGDGADGGSPPADPMDGGQVDGSTVSPPPATDSGAVDTGPGNPADPLDSARRACVDHINQYRATLGLEPLRRATAEQEACSDQGAQQDATGGGAHSSAGNCQGMGAQNTCPGWQVGGWGGGATLEDTVRSCLDSMWAEGEPPVPVDDCIRDYTNCFLVYGHYINMSSPTSTVVSCGFYEMSPGTWWINQDFGR